MTRMHIIDTDVMCAGALDTGYYVGPHTYKRVYSSMEGSRSPPSCLIRQYPSAHTHECSATNTEQTLWHYICAHIIDTEYHIRLSQSIRVCVRQDTIELSKTAGFYCPPQMNTLSYMYAGQHNIQCLARQLTMCLPHDMQLELY